MRPLTKKQYLSALITHYLVYKQLEKENFSQALDYVNRALVLDPQSASALTRKGLVLHSLGWERLVVPIRAENRAI